MERFLTIFRSKLGFSIVMLVIVAVFAVLVFSIIPLNQQKFETQLRHQAKSTLTLVHDLVETELLDKSGSTGLQLAALTPQLLSEARITTLIILQNQVPLYQRTQSSYKIDYQSLSDSTNFLKGDEFFLVRSYPTAAGKIRYIMGMNVAESNELHSQIRFNFGLIVCFVLLVTISIYGILRISYLHLQQQVMNSISPLFDGTSPNLNQQEFSTSSIDFSYIESIHRVLASKIANYKAAFGQKQQEQETAARALEQSIATLNREKEELTFKSNLLYTEINNLETALTSLQTSQFVELAVTQFNNILQAQQGSISEWGQQVLESIIQQTDSVQGALFAFNSKTKKPQLIGHYNYALSEQTPRLYDEKDGLGAVALKQNRVLHLESEYVGQFRVLSSAAQLCPSSVMIVPIILNEDPVGVLELSSLSRYSENQLEFIEKIRTFLAASLINLINKEDIRNLLYEAQEKTEMLMAQEEEMRQNIEELEATQEEMRRVENELRTSEDRLKQLNENLEAIVAERTYELRTTLSNLESTQAQLIQSEKMASLGQLVAGVAHEINTPIGAIKASATNMSDVLPAIIKQLPVFRFDKEHQVLLSHILEDVLLNDNALTSKEERLKRKELMRQLEELGVTDAEEISRKLVEVGVIERIEKYLPLFGTEKSHAILDIVYSLGQLKVNLDNINIAAEKTKKIVFALKNYSHTQSQEALIKTNIKDSIEIILTLYHNQIKYGIELIKNYEDVPDIPTYPDELGQVWTNLIHNALQAMNYNGKMQIDILNEPNDVVVRITDFGPGIPAEIQAKIFDAFFTTKAPGEGSGLGLDICKKIILKHNGKIDFQSVPGETTFRVSLPKRLS